MSTCKTGHREEAPRKRLRGRRVKRESDHIRLPLSYAKKKKIEGERKKTHSDREKEREG